MNFLLLYQSQ